MSRHCEPKAKQSSPFDSPAPAPLDCFVPRIKSAVLAITMALPLLAACTDKAPAPDPTISVYGMSQAQLAACAGAPATRSSLGDVDYLSYRTTLVVGKSALADLPKIPVIGSLAFGDPGHQVACEATVVLRAGRVDSVSYHTIPPQNAPQAAQICRPILQACLPSGQGGS
jgi:hypothetical protein